MLWQMCVSPTELNVNILVHEKYEIWWLFKSVLGSTPNVSTVKLVHISVTMYTKNPIYI
jgi:hypothetical protein